jgi:fructose-1,6-bisphosphatase/inositol monophosphatase family enzyme
MIDDSTLLDVERRALSQEHEVATHGSASSDNDNDWVAFCLRFLVEVLHELRQVRFADLASEISIKTDGSPVSSIELRIESLCRERLSEFDRSASVVGEEQGGEIDPSGVSLAIDPIDGSWSFVNRAETFTTTLALFRHGNAELAFVANPATGEIAYVGSGGARLLQLGLAGEPTLGYDLPLPRSSTSGLLVNLHPTRQMGSTMAKLISGWESGGVQLVKAVGGSPVWSMLDAAKGACTYVNLWPGKPADPFDLAAGLLIVRAAGGEVVDLAGHPVSMTEHSGPFIAGTEIDNLQRVTRGRNRRVIICRTPAHR